MLWLVRLRGQQLGRPVSAVWFDSNAVEMTTAEHFMYLMKFLSCLLASVTILFWRIEIYVWNLHICLFNYFDCDVSNLQELEPARLKFYKNRSLHHSESNRLEKSQDES